MNRAHVKNELESGDKNIECHHFVFLGLILIFNFDYDFEF